MTHDLRYALRQVIHRPVWTFVVVLTLALGVGANTSVLTLVDSMLFKPASWNGHGRLIWIASMNGRSNRIGPISYPDYLAYHDQTTTLSGVLAQAGNGVAVGGAPAEVANAGLVSGNYFDVLQVRPQIGRMFTPEEDTVSGAHPVVILSDAFWKQHFGADPEVINRVVAINGRPFTIVGVAPSGFTGIAYADNAEQLWIPLAMARVALPNDPDLLTRTDTGWLHVVGRLRDGETIGRAAAEMHVIAAQLNPRGTPTDREKDARVLPVRGGMTPSEQHDFGPVFGLIAIAPALVLLVACANVANVLTARNVSRRKELAMRQSVGASRGRLVRLLLMESWVLAVLSGAAGFAASFALTALIAHYGEVPADVSALVMPDRRALLAAMTVAVLTTVLFGLAPALTATRFDLLPALKDEGTTSTAASGRTRLRQLFIVVQVALSLMLLIVAGLFLQSLLRTTRVDPGFEPHGLVTVSFNTDLVGYDASRRNAFAKEFMRRASSIPGAISTTASNALPLSGDMYEATVVATGATAPVHATSASVAPRYFEAMRLPLLRGRDFTEGDANAPVAIVNETLAQRLWPRTNAIGQRVRVDDSREPWRDVIGVARDAKYLHLTESQRAAYYVPWRAETASVGSLVVRARDTRAALSSLTKIAHDLDPNLPLFKVQTVDEQIHDSMNLQRAAASLLGVLGALALLLGAVGLYGVATHSVSVRTREIGIRMSLGARAIDVFRMVVQENLSLSVIGVVIGLGISVAGSRILTSFLFGLTPTDPLTFVSGSMILSLVTMLATYFPARRAAHVDPVVALRHE